MNENLAPSFLVDTQIVSLAFKGDQDAYGLAQSNLISSITASEFLLLQGKEGDKPDYAVLPISRYPMISEGTPLVGSHFGNKKWAKYAFHKTDQFVLDFGNDYELIVDYGSRAISTIINSNQHKFYSLCISHLKKSKQKYLTKRLEFLCSGGIQCIPLSEQIGNIALLAFQDFVKKHNPKSNIRNTVNDMLIAATARTLQMPLITKDKLLFRFVADLWGARLQLHGDWMEMGFTSEATARRESSESKGYVNRSWRVRVLRGQV